MTSPDSPSTDPTPPSGGASVAPVAAKSAAKGGVKKGLAGAAKFAAGAIGGEKAEAAVESAEKIKGGVDRARAGASRAKSIAKDVAGDFKGPENLEEAGQQLKDDAKELGGAVAKGAAQGAIRGATKGGVWGAVIQGALEAGKGALRTRGGRRLLYLYIALTIIPPLVVALVATSVVVSVTSGKSNQEDSNSTVAAEASGATAENVSAAIGTDGTVPWTLWLWVKENKKDVSYDQLQSALNNTFTSVNPTLVMGVQSDGVKQEYRLGDSTTDKAEQERNAEMVVNALLSLREDGTVDADWATSSASPEPTESAPPTPTPTASATPEPPAGVDISDPNSITFLANPSHPIPNAPGFAPQGLVNPGDLGIRQTSNPDQMLRGEAADALKEMFVAAGQAGVSLGLDSAYRSYELQTSLCGGSGPCSDPTTAEPGKSEHQLGLAVDISDANDPGTRVSDSFGASAAGAWAMANADRYGFIHRYPAGSEAITGIPAEAWHFRYVGKEVAAAFKASGKATYEEFVGAAAGSSAPAAATSPASPPRPGYFFTESEAKTAFETSRMWAMGQASGCGSQGTATPSASTTGEEIAADGVTWKPAQTAIAADIIGATKGYFAGASPATIERAAIIALATAMQESTLTNVEHGDEAGPDSRGIFQQRDPWGTEQQRLTPAWATAKFLSVLASVPGWEQMKLGDAAYKVQVFGDGLEPEYDKWEPAAKALWDQLGPKTAAIGKPADLPSYESQAMPGTGTGASAAGAPGQACSQQQQGSFGQLVGGVALPLDAGSPIYDFFGHRSCGGNCSPYHRGIDISPTCGTPVYVIADGTVVQAANDGSVGNTITVFHPAVGMTSGYMHVQTMLFKPGDQVKKGQQIATVGNGNGNYPCHLHFQIHVGQATMFQNRIDPLPVMRSWGADFCQVYVVREVSGNNDCANPNFNDPDPEGAPAMPAV